MTVQGPAKKSQMDYMSYRGLHLFDCIHGPVSSGLFGMCNVWMLFLWLCMSVFSSAQRSRPELLRPSNSLRPPGPSQSSGGPLGPSSSPALGHKPGAARVDSQAPTCVTYAAGLRGSVVSGSRRRVR